MSVTVRIPTQLRPLTGGSGEIAVEATTVRETLQALDAAHPGIAERLLDGNGGLRRFVNVFLADESNSPDTSRCKCRHDKGLRPMGSEISLFQ